MGDRRRTHQSFREGLLQQGEAQREPWVLLPALPCDPTQVRVSLLPGSCSCDEVCSQIPQAATAGPLAGICCASRKYARKYTVLACLLLVSLFVLYCLIIVWMCFSLCVLPWLLSYTLPPVPGQAASVFAVGLGFLLSFQHFPCVACPAAPAFPIAYSVSCFTE